MASLGLVSSTERPGESVWLWSVRSVGVRTQHFGAHHGLVQAELTVELLDRSGLGRQGDDGIDAFGLLVDLICQAPAAPYVDGLDAATVLAHQVQVLVERRLDRTLLEVWVEDDHQLVVAHERHPPPVDFAVTVSP